MNVIASYPDQLVRDVWVRWCQDALDPSRGHMRGSTDFQGALGSSNSNDRSRAGEIYALGLLKGPLVRPQRASGAAVPLGWSLAQSELGALSQLGYLAYAIGRALADPMAPTTIHRAFSVLCTIFVLQLGAGHNAKYILTSSLYQYLLKKFRPSQEFPENWNRFLAAAMFCTLNSAQKESLIEKCSRDDRVDKLRWVSSNGSEFDVDPNQLAQMASGGVSISDVSPPKAALYWIGSVQDSLSRGMYALAIQEGKVLLELVTGLEREFIGRGQGNPFSGMVDKALDLEQNVLEKLDATFRINDQLSAEWEVLMRTLADGVIDAFEYITNGATRVGTRTFYAHEPEDIVGEFSDFELEVAVNECVSTPAIDDRIVVRGLQYRVLEVSENSGAYVIRLGGA